MFIPDNEKYDEYISIIQRSTESKERESDTIINDAGKKCDQKVFSQHREFGTCSFGCVLVFACLAMMASAVTETPLVHARTFFLWHSPQ